MGTRTLGLLDYHLPQDVRREPLRVLDLLGASIPACLAVERYWQANDPDSEADPTGSWGVYDRDGEELTHWWIGGPGGMVIRFGPRVARVRASARWRGFLTIPALRQVHRAAFAAIGRAVGATRILLVPDYAEELIEAAEGGKSFDECVRLMQTSWGPAQGGLDQIGEPSRPSVIIALRGCGIWSLRRTAEQAQCEGSGTCRKSEPSQLLQRPAMRPATCRRSAVSSA